MNNEKKNDCQAVFNKLHTVKVGIKLNEETDADILAWIKGVNASNLSVQGYVKALIRNDIRAFIDDVKQKEES
ncbi:MAG: hypothetical protein ACI4EG_12990 [Fusicatenibacter sp.]